MSIGVGGGGGPGIGYGPGGYGAYGGSGGTGVGVVLSPSAGSSGAVQPIPDSQVIDVTVQHALEFKPTGEAAGWTNPDTGNSGSVTPTRTYQNAAGETCREFLQTMSKGGSVYGSACRDSAGVWQVGTS